VFILKDVCLDVFILKDMCLDVFILKHMCFQNTFLSIKRKLEMGSQEKGMEHTTTTTSQACAELLYAAALLPVPVIWLTRNPN
jgi:hypothetical protein